MNKYILIPGSGVNLNYYKPIDYPSNASTEFVFISRVMKEKGIEQYLDMAKYIHSKYPKTKFHICGFAKKNMKEFLKIYKMKIS